MQVASSNLHWLRIAMLCPKQTSSAGPSSGTAGVTETAETGIKLEMQPTHADLGQQHLRTRQPWRHANRQYVWRWTDPAHCRTRPYPEHDKIVPTPARATPPGC